MCLGVVFFGSNLFGTVCVSWTYMSISFSILGKFSFIIFSNKFSISCPSSFPSAIHMIWMLGCLKMSQRLLILFFFFFKLFLHAVLIECLVLPYIQNHFICILASSPSLLVPCRFFFMSLSVNFTSSFILLPYSRILWASRSPVFWTLMGIW